MKRRILVIHPEGNVHNNPNLLGIVKILCDSGYEVDLFSIFRDGAYQGPVCENCNHYVFENVSPIPNHYGYVSLLSLPEINGDTVANFFISKIRKYDLVIGVDRGIIEASIIAGYQNIPLGLISYEIFFEDESSVDFKAPEIEACANLSFAVCQDDLRARFLCIENKIDPYKIIKIPVVGRGFKKNAKSDYFYRKFNIPSHKKIAIYTGSISIWGGTDYLFNSAKMWPDDWVLVLHARYGNDPFTNANKDLLKSNKIFISDEAVDSVEDMDKILDSVDLGITFYKPTYDSIWTGKNLEYIGLASGKSFTYLQNNIPVLINEIGEMSDVIRNNNLGFIYDKSEPIVINLTEQELAVKRNNIENYFTRFFDLDELSKPLLDKIYELISTGSVSKAI